jgi:hypothetical protein
VLADPPQLPLEEDLEKMMKLPNTTMVKDGNYTRTFSEPGSNTGNIMEWITPLTNFELAENEVNANNGSNLDGLRGRTLHPRKLGHENMGKRIVEHLKQHLDNQSEEPPVNITPPPDPAPTEPTEPVKVGRTLTVGMQESWSCRDDFRGFCYDFTNRYFFFTTDTTNTNLGKEPGTICGELADGVVDERTWGGQNDYEKPSWPQVDFQLTLNGKKYTYTGDGKYPGKLVSAEGDIVHNCWGDLNQPDPLGERFCRENSPFERRRRLVSCEF